jgi:hypothetical protein
VSWLSQKVYNIFILINSLAINKKARHTTVCRAFLFWALADFDYAQPKPNTKPQLLAFSHEYVIHVIEQIQRQMVHWLMGTLLFVFLGMPSHRG